MVCWIIQNLQPELVLIIILRQIRILVKTDTCPVLVGTFNSASKHTATAAVFNIPLPNKEVQGNCNKSLPGNHG